MAPSSAKLGAPGCALLGRDARAVARIRRRSPTAYSPYSRSGCTATATFDNKVQGVVVQTRSWRPGSSSSGKVTYTEFVVTVSYPSASSWLESTVPQRGQYG